MQVAILGLGLIGSSLGLALKQGQHPPTVVGFDVSVESLRRAGKSGAIDRSCGTLAEVCQGSDIVVLAAPARAILELLPEIAPHLSGQTLVTDTGGTKAEIVRTAELALPGGAAFVGGHPMAGRLTAGVGQADSKLFLGTLYCLTPSVNTPAWAVEVAVQLVERVGAQPHFLDAEEHDSLLAAISHLPYFTSAALVNAVSAQESWREMATMAAGGFRAMSALVDVDPNVWADVASTNRRNIARQIDALIAELSTFRDLITEGGETLTPALERAQRVHQEWLASRGETAQPPQPASSPLNSPSSWIDRFRRS